MRWQSGAGSSILQLEVAKLMTRQRRDAGRARGKPIEQVILAAALAELAEHGLEGLSVSRIAELSEVNKTTIYRRWSTREALVAAALEGALREAADALHDTGSLRGDLRAMLDTVAERMASPGGRALVQAAMSDAATAAVAELGGDEAIRSQQAAVDLVARAAERGEWDPERHLPDAVFAMITGSVMHRVLLERQPITDAWAQTIVDVIVAGLGVVADRGRPCHGRAVPAHHVALASLPHQARAIVRVTGEDALRFLQGLLSANVGELAPGRATSATLLTVKGKIVSEVWVLAVSEDEPWLAIPAELGDAVIAKLDGHIIMDDVELEPLADHGCVIVWSDEGGLAASELSLPEGVLAFEATHPLPGVLLVGPHAALEQFSLGEPADVEAFTTARITHARPAWGHEIAVDRFPPEVGFVDAVSYDKGCFLGQEPLSRIHNRGQVNRVMVRVELDAVPGEVGPIELRAGEVEAGSLTSWTVARRGLAIVKRAHAKPGTSLRAGEVGVTVSSGPLGDDPGRAGRTQTATVALGGRR
jgi:tRNA-modifying protein YgfZ